MNEEKLNVDGYNIVYTNQHKENGLTPKDVMKVLSWREGQWNRPYVEKLAKLAVKGGPLHFFHPGEITVYRGMSLRGAPYTKMGTSWSKDKRIANRYTDAGKETYELQLSLDTPAIDINKLLKGNPSDSSYNKEREVFIARGNHPVKVMRTKKLESFKEYTTQIKSPGLEYHIKNSIPLSECVYRWGSTAHLDLINEAREKRETLNLNEREQEILDSDLGKFALYEGKTVPLDLPLEEEEDVELNKPKRGGSKKFYVYVKNDKGNVIKVEFGDTSGLNAKINNPEARKSFAARHNCAEKKDKTKPGYWACRLPWFAKSLGLSGGGRFFW